MNEERVNFKTLTFSLIHFANYNTHCPLDLNNKWDWLVFGSYKVLVQQFGWIFKSRMVLKFIWNDLFNQFNNHDELHRQYRKATTKMKHHKTWVWCFNSAWIYSNRKLKHVPSLVRLCRGIGTNFFFFFIFVNVLASLHTPQLISRGN